MEKDPAFFRPMCESHNEERERAYLQSKRLFQYDFLPETSMDPLKFMSNIDLICSFDPSVSAKFGLNRNVCHIKYPFSTFIYLFCWFFIDLFNYAKIYSFTFFIQ